MNIVWFFWMDLAGHRWSPPRMPEVPSGAPEKWAAFARSLRLIPAKVQQTIMSPNTRWCGADLYIISGGYSLPAFDPEVPRLYTENAPLRDGRHIVLDPVGCSGVCGAASEWASWIAKDPDVPLDAFYSDYIAANCSGEVLWYKGSGGPVHVFVPLQCEWDQMVRCESPVKQNLAVVELAHEFAQAVYGENYMIHVKHHPRMPTSSAEDLTRDRQDVVDPEVSAMECVCRADVVFTNNSSVGFDALAARKPVVTLGPTPYAQCGDLTFRFLDHREDAAGAWAEYMDRHESAEYSLTLDRFLYWFRHVYCVDVYDPESVRRRIRSVLGEEITMKDDMFRGVYDRMRPTGDWKGGPPGVRTLQHAWEFDELRRLYTLVQPRRVLEIGSYEGGTLWNWVTLANWPATVVSLDSRHAERHETWRSWAGDLVKLHCICADSHEPATLEQVKQVLPSIDWLFIDGDHSYDGVRLDFQMYGPLVRDGGLIIFHDICYPENDSSVQVRKLWREIKEAGFITRELYAKPDQRTAGIGIVFVSSSGLPQGLLPAYRSPGRKAF